MVAVDICYFARLYLDIWNKLNSSSRKNLRIHFGNRKEEKKDSFKADT